MEINELKAIVEGILFASGDDGVTKKQLAFVLDVSENTITHLLDELMYDYENTNRGFVMISSHDYYYLTTKPEHSHYFKKLLESPHSNKLTQAALETLAIIAYKQPVTRTEMEEVRGVKSDHSVQTLLARSLIEEMGKKDSIGRPVLFGTSKDFLTYFGLTSLEELPPLQDSLDEDEMERETELLFQQLEENKSTDKDA